ncbi:cryptochrome/photolyase family protein [Polynucleobacter necessarius]|uniref:cryptochrome/photolyase family protein n=1 Tax=Polynucleobacter necessarius TaxID=576610 RepID=UPI002F95B874
MKPEKRLILILGDQLDLQGAALTDFDPHADEVVMIESISEAQYIWTHKAKIALFLSAMRHFAQALIDLGYSVRYIKASPLSISQTLKEQVLASNVQRVVCVEPGEWRLKQELEAMAQELKITLDIRVDDHFFCTQQEFREWVADKKRIKAGIFLSLHAKKTRHLNRS